jgi:intracellular sulfur oxidation DsrE/DsrF family protein
MMTTTHSQEALQILLHAPTAPSLARARSNAANIVRSAPHVSVRIVVNAEAVAAALDQPDAAFDALTLVCPNTLARLGREAARPLTVLAMGAVLEIAEMQMKGWCYVRA